MRAACVLLALAFAGCAEAPPTADSPAAPVDDGTAVLAELRAQTLRVRQGQEAQLHAELAAALDQHRGDRHLRFLDAAVGLPSERAWELLKRLSAEEPKDAWPLLGMAMTYVSWNMVPQAGPLLDRVEALKPGYLPTALVRAQALQKQGAPGARAAFEAILQKADLPEAHAGVGELALAAGDVATAKRELGLAAQGDPGDLGVLRALARLAQATHDDAAGLVAWKALVAASPGDGAALLELARVEEATGDVPGARRDFTRATELRGVDLETAQHLAALARKAGDEKALPDALETLARIDKANPQPELDLAELALARKDVTGAEAHYRAAAERDPQRAATQLALARLYRDARRTREAIEAYQLATRLPQPPPEAAAEVAPLLADLKLPDEPISGDVNTINARFNADLHRFYRARLRVKGGIKGSLKLAVVVDAEGQVTSVGLTPDGIDDEPVLLHAYFVMKQARFPKAKRNPVFQVELLP
jgi:tetratricopeptide (TPR) repeat protein